MSYKVVNGTHYHSDTPDDLIVLLESLRKDKTRVVLTYGDKKTGVAEVSATPERGHIGRTMGMSPCPILIRTTRSRGGEMISSQCIIKVALSVGGIVLWKHTVPDTTIRLKTITDAHGNAIYVLHAHHGAPGYMTAYLIHANDPNMQYVYNYLRISEYEAAPYTSFKKV